jgi:CheY-like chemotaxis protein
MAHNRAAHTHPPVPPHRPADVTSRDWEHVVILIVDDHFDTGTALARMLRKRGHEAVAVDSGPAALKWLETTRPRVLVLDMMMPEMDGLEMLERVRNDPRVKDLPVVVFSADYNFDTMQKARGLGAQEFIVKGTLGWDRVCDTIGRYAGA